MTSNDIDKKIELLYSTAKRLVDEGKDDSMIVSELCKDGEISEDYANQILENIYDDKYDKKEFIKHTILGSFITVGGLLTNYLSYQFAITTGSTTFLLIWGVVVIGVIVLIRGFILFKK